MSPVCARQKKKCKATYCYLTPIYIYLYTCFYLFFYFPRLVVLQCQHQKQYYHTYTIDEWHVFIVHLILLL